jgi:hypothetical protein
MKYLAEVTVDDVEYEAWVDVRTYDSCEEVEFATVLAYVDNESIAADDLPDVVIDLLFDDAVEQYRTDNGADEIYQAWRDMGR